MQRTLLLSKIHRARVTGADLDYEGSIAIDTRLIEAAGLLPHERVDIYNVTNGNRLSTYIIPGSPGEICLNGAAAHLVDAGDEVIIAAYAQLSDAEARAHEPTVVLVDADNTIREIRRHSGAPATV
ncbi:MAG: aspartate 1-decarboxylase [Opitutales bacterium]